MHQGNIPLHCAAHTGDAETVKVLVEADSSQLAVVDNYGATVLHNAVFAASVGAVEALLAAKADANALLTSGRSVLHVASEKGGAKVVSHSLTQPLACRCSLAYSPTIAPLLW